MDNLLAQFGTVNPPPGVSTYGSFANAGVQRFITNILWTLIVIGGIYAVFNFVLAGYSFMSAGSDPKKMAEAWAKIWQTMMGLIFVAGAFVIGGMISSFLFGNPATIFQIRVYGP